MAEETIPNADVTYASRFAGLLGRNRLIGAATAILVVLSGYATWHGMRDFIVGVSSDGNGLAFGTNVLIIAIVLALTFLMWIALGEALGRQRTLRERAISLPLYAFLAVWSVGFGYGFWWSLIAGQEATRSGLAGLEEDARDSAQAIMARLDAVRTQLDGVVAWSDSQMAREQSGGGSCGTPSGAGRGQLYSARKGVRDTISALRDSVTRSWIDPVAADIQTLQASAVQDPATTLSERQARFERSASLIRGKAKAIAARSNELGKSLAGEMRALAESVSVQPGRPQFMCYDRTLADRLRQAADQASQPVLLKLRDASFQEGPAGVANAIKNLWENMGAYLAALPHYLVGAHTDLPAASGDPITGRDLIALLATLGIDIGILALTALNPPAPATPARDALMRPQARLRLPSAEVVRQLSSAIRTAISAAPGADLQWVRRHFVSHGDCSYFVIPNLHSAKDLEADEATRALAMNQLAGVLRDLHLVRSLTNREKHRLALEETLRSVTDLEALKVMAGRARSWIPRWQDTGDAHDAKAPRNHALISKAQVALRIAKWSPTAQADIELFRLYDCDGLPPILTLLNEAATEADIPADRVQPEFRLPTFHSLL